jgi:hypothetical protein
MILVRAVFQAKVGKAQELVTNFKTAMQPSDTPNQSRMLTDLSGPWDTVVVETVAESLADWERQRAEMFASPQFQAMFARVADLVVSGRNEFYTIEA